jgi:hypothetical protein
MTLDKNTFLQLFATFNGIFKDNTSREITEEKMRQFAQAVGDSLMFLKEHAHESFLLEATGTNTYTTTTSVTTNSPNPIFIVYFQNANTGPSTLIVQGFGQYPIKLGNNDLTSGQIKANSVAILVFKNNTYQLISGGSGGGGGGGGAVNSVFGRTGDVLPQEGDYTFNQLADVQITAPQVGEIIRYDGSLFRNLPFPQATETAIGGGQLATQAISETAGNATSASGADHTRIATPRALWWFYEARRLLGLFYNWLFDFVTEAGTSHTFVLSDAGKSIQYTSNSNVTVTIPNDSTIDFPIGTRIRHRRRGNGLVTLAPASGVTLHTTDNNLIIRKLNDYIDMVKIAANTWQIDHGASSSWEFFKTQPATITAAWEIIGTDDSNLTYCFVLKNLSNNVIARFRNDQVFEVGGNSHYIKVPSGIASGNAKLEFLDNLGLAYIFGTASNNFLEFQSTNNNFRVRALVPKEMQTANSTMLWINFETQVSATLNQTTTIGSFPIPNNTIANVEISWTCSEGTNAQAGGGFVHHTIRRFSDTVAAVGSQTDVIRRSGGSFVMAIVPNNTNKTINFNFTNNTSGTAYAFKVNVHARIFYTPYPT